MTAGGDQSGYAQREKVVELRRQRLGSGELQRFRSCQSTGSGQCQRTRHSDISISRNGWIIGRNSRQPRPPTVTLRNLVTVVIRSLSVTETFPYGVGNLRDSR